MDNGRKRNVVINVNTAQNRQLRSARDFAGMRIRLLGPLAIENGGRPVVIASKKARALIGYLALRQGTEIPRSILTGLLWGERSESQARASLRQTLSELRHALSGSATKQECLDGHCRRKSGLFASARRDTVLFLAVRQHA